MKTKTLILALVLVAVLAVPVALAADGEGPRHPRTGDGPRGNFERPGMGQGFGDGNLAQMVLGKMGEDLNLTDEQKESIKKIAEEAKAGTKENRTAVYEAMQALNAAAEDGTEEEIVAAGKAAGDALTKQAINRAEVTKKIKAVLTEEQLAKLEEMKTKMKERMEQRMEQMQSGEGPRRGEGRRGPQQEAPEAPQD